MTETSALYRLQAIDSQYDTLRSRLNEINALLGQSKHIQAAREALSSREVQTRAVLAQVNSLELDVAGIEEKANATETRLYAGAITNPKELQDMQQELVSLGKRREALEDEMLENMELLEGHEARVQQARQQLEQAEAEWARDQSKLVDEKEQIEANLTTVQAQRIENEAQLDAVALQVYETLRDKLRGIAVAAIKDGVCSACGVAPTTTALQQARHGKLDARCPTCQRILVAN